MYLIKPVKKTTIIAHQVNAVVSAFEYMSTIVVVMFLVIVLMQIPLIPYIGEYLCYRSPHHTAQPRVG
jgi:hypothetical protein